VPKPYLAPMKSYKGLFEARIKLAWNIWRVFCFFDKGKLVILLNGFNKKTKKMETKNWKDIKDTVYGEKGTERRDQLERDFESFKISLLLRNAREQKHLTQKQLAELIDKKRTYISRVVNNGSNLTLKTLFDIVEKGLGGKVNISIDL
jgi:ribosome-binding protein aMBF1 (putative translation factor)